MGYNPLLCVIVSNIFYFHPYLLGEMIQFDEHIFQVGGSTTNKSKPWLFAAYNRVYYPAI